MPTQTGGVRVASAKDLKEGAPFCAVVNGKNLAVIQVEGKVHAIDNACTHAGGPLCEGAVKDGVVTCPWHGSRFKIATGEAVHGPAKAGVKSYPVDVRGDDVYVMLDPATAAADAKPKAVQFAFTPAFDAEHPFANEGFVTDLLKELQFPFKLYGTLPYVVIAQSADEIDAHLGEIHITEVDLQKLSGVMKALNEKWKVNVTFCIFHSSQFPGVMLLNVRGPHAPMNVENTITY